MIRATTKQFARLKANAEGKPSGRRQRPMAETPENILESQILGFLRIRGWLVIRQQVGLFRRPMSNGRIMIGEKGMADWLAVRSLHGNYPSTAGQVELFWLECKAPGKKPSPDQAQWLANRRALDFEAEWFDRLDGFLLWYKARFS